MDDSEAEALIGEAPLEANGTSEDTVSYGGVDRPTDEESTDRFEDILEAIGTKGRWNITIFFVCSLAPFANAFQALSYEFLGYTPEYWCHVGPLVDANWTTQEILSLAIPHSNGSIADGCQMYNYNYTLAAENGYSWSIKNIGKISIGNAKKTVKCKTRDFNTSVYSSTVVTQWDLVCERRALYSSTQAANQFGALLGATTLSYFLDKYGRRPMILTCEITSLVVGIVSAWSPSLTFYIIMKILIACALTGVYYGCFVQVMEICSPSQRSSVGTLFVMPWALAYMTIPAVAYFVRTWRWLQLGFVTPISFLLLHIWLLPESPRWLLSKGRTKKAMKVLVSAAKVNGKTLPPHDEFLASLEALTSHEEENPRWNLVSSIKTNLKYVSSLFLQPDLRIRTLVCFFCWFGVGTVYYGVSLNSANLNVNLYLYVFLGGAVEVVAYVMLGIMLRFLGRKTSLIILYSISASTISTIAILFGLLGSVSTKITMVLSLSGKMAITAAFHLVYIYTAELFPTKYRSLALGESGSMSSIGSICSPYIDDILGAAITWGPSALFASISLIAAGLALILPETKGTDLTEEKKKKQLGIR